MDMPFTIETTGVVGSGGLVGIFLTWYLRAASGMRRTIFKRIDELQSQINAHSLYDAQTYVTRAEMAAMRDHLDQKFDMLNTNLINAIRDNNHRRE